MFRIGQGFVALDDQDHGNERQQSIPRKHTAPTQEISDGPPGNHAQPLAQKGYPHKGADGALPLLDRKNVTDQRQRYRHDRSRKNAGQSAIGGQVGQSESGGAQTCGPRKQNNRKGDDLLFPIAVGQRAEDNLKNAEGNHIGGDQQSCPLNSNPDVFRNRRQDG